MGNSHNVVSYKKWDKSDLQYGYKYVHRKSACA